MSREQSDGENDVVGTEVDRCVDATAETEVELLLPLEAGMDHRPDILLQIATRLVFFLRYIYCSCFSG